MYKSISPIGEQYVSLDRAKEYKKLYGWPYVEVIDEEEKRLVISILRKEINKNK